MQGALQYKVYLNFNYIVRAKVAQYIIFRIGIVKHHTISMANLWFKVQILHCSGINERLKCNSYLYLRNPMRWRKSSFFSQEMKRVPSFQQVKPHWECDSNWFIKSMEAARLMFHRHFHFPDFRITFSSIHFDNRWTFQTVTERVWIQEKTPGKKCID